MTPLSTETEIPMSDHQLQQIVRAASVSAAGKHGVLSTGEGLAAALIRNRPDLLGSYTIVEALERIGEHWAALLPAAARQFQTEQDQQREQIQNDARNQRIEALTADVPADTTVNANATLVTYGNAPGYRSCSLLVDVQPLGSERVHRLELYFRKDDSLAILAHLMDVNRFAWREGRDGPIDRIEGEKRPAWL